MRFLLRLIVPLVFAAGFSSVSAQESGLWQKAFARPNGAILVDEVMHEPERFLVQHQGQEITIAGKFQAPNVARDGSATRATIVWGGRYSGIACVSYERVEMFKVVDLVQGEEVRATGTVKRFRKGWMYLENCTIEAGVTLFHSRDPKFILGSWCGVYQGKTFRKLVFSRGSGGQYLQTAYEVGSDGNWRPWVTGTKASRIKRVSARQIETAFIGPKHDYNRDRFTIVSHNQMSKTGGFQFYRCQ